MPGNKAGHDESSAEAVLIITVRAFGIGNARSAYFPRTGLVRSRQRRMLTFLTDSGGGRWDRERRFVNIVCLDAVAVTDHFVARRGVASRIWSCCGVSSLRWLWASS